MTAYEKLAAEAEAIRNKTAGGNSRYDKLVAEQRKAVANKQLETNLGKMNFGSAAASIARTSADYAAKKTPVPAAPALPSVKPIIAASSLRLPESAAAVTIQKRVAETVKARTVVPVAKPEPTADMNVLQKIDYYKNKYNPLALGDMVINQAGAGAAQFGAAVADSVVSPLKGRGVNYPKAQTTAEAWSAKPAVPTTPVTKYINNARETLSLARKARQNYYLSGNTVQDKSDAYSAKIADKYADLTDNDVTKALSDLASSAGYMIPVAVTNMIIPSSGTALLFAAGYSSGERQALKAGGTAAEASAYAYLNGLNQSVGEMLIGGVLGKGEGAIDSLLKKVGVDLTAKIANPTIKAWADYAVSVFGEGAEEVVQGVADIAMQKTTYNPAAKLNAGDLAYQGLLGGALGGVFDAGKLITDIKTGLTLPSVKAQPQSVNAPAQTSTDTPQSTINAPLQLPHVELNAAQATPQTFADRNAADVSAIANKLQTGLRGVTGDETLTRYNAAKTETERTGAIYNADAESVSTASKIATAGGLDVRYYRQESSNGAIQNGFTKDGVLYLNAASKQAAPQIIAHELTHNLENAKAYTALSEYVIGKLDAQTLAQMRTDITELYRQTDPTFDEPDADREIVAQYTESKLFTDETAVMDVVRTDRKTGEKIHTWLSGMVTKLTGTAEEKYLLRAKELYSKALAQTRAADTVQAKTAASISKADDTQSDNFKQWFGDWQNSPETASRVVDKSGKPLKVYHGRSSIKGINVFDMSERGGGKERRTVGAYFSANKEYAASYPSGAGNPTVGAYLNIKNPYMATEYSDIANIGEERRTELEKQGYDGVVFHDNDTGPYATNLGDFSEVLVFSPSQIKSATDNVGTYDSNNPDIRYSISAADSDGNALSDKQQEYFKDSKIVDTDGKIKPVYHGTNKEFNTFESKRGVYWFSENSDYSEEMAYVRNGNIIKQMYLNITNPYEASLKPNEFSDPSYEKPIIDKAKREGYDGIIIKADTDEELLKDTFYVAFKQEQIKLTSNKSPTTSPDIRYSITPDNTRTATNTSEDVTAAKQARTTITQLESENKQLKELNAAQRKQVQRTTTIEPNVYAVTAYVRQLRKGYDSVTPMNNLTGRMAALFTYVANGDEAGGTDWNMMYDTARDIAGDILSGSEVLVNGSELEQYSDIKKYMKAKTFYVAAEKKSDLGDYGAFRKHNFGRFKLTADKEGDGRGVDTSYAEMTELYGEGLFPSEIINQTDQLQQISNVLDGMGAVYENPYSGKVFDEASAFIANDILDKFYDIPQAAPTFADKADKKLTLQKVKDKSKIDTLRERKNARIEQVREKLKENTARRLLEQHQANDAKIVKLKERTHASVALAIKNRNDTDIRRRLKRNCVKMATMLSTPDKNSHVPDDMRQAVAGLFNMIEFSPDEVIQDGDSKGKKKSDVLKERLAKVADVYRLYIATNDSVKPVLDTDLQNMFDEAKATLEHKSIRQMNSEELLNLSNLTKSIYKAIAAENKAFVKGQHETIDGLGQAVRDDNKSKASRKDPTNAAETADNLLNFSMIDPRPFFRRLGKTMENLYMNIERGQDKYIETVTRTVDFMKKTLAGIDTTKWDGKDADLITVGVYGDYMKSEVHEVQFTPAMLIDLYLLNKRPQARKHIYGEAGISLMLPGAKKTQAPLMVTEDDVNAIIAKMTPDMVRVAEAMGKYVTTEMSALGNEVTLALYGYSKFTEENYWRIDVDKGGLPSPYGETVGDPKLANNGTTKATKAEAKNAIVIKSAIDVFDHHTVQMAAYNSYVQPLSDMERVLNNKDEHGMTVASVISDKHGAEADTYIRKFMGMVNGAQLSNNLWNDKISSKLLRGFKAAAVGLNFSVVAKQPVSYIRAADMINPKYLMQVLNFESRATRKKNMAEMLKYNPIGRIKDWGYADMGFGKNQRQLYDRSAMTMMDKVSEVSGYLPSQADKITWGRIWAAVKLEQTAKGVYDMTKMAERFKEVISNTQVVNTIFTTPPILNTDSIMAKMATSFMGEPMKTFNMEVDAIRSGNKHRIMRVSAVLIANQFVVAMVSTAFKHLRNKDDEEVTAASLSKEVLSSMLWDTVGIIPYIRDIVSLFQGYDINRTDMTGIAKIVDAIKGAAGDIGRQWNGEEPTGTAIMHVKDLSNAVCDTVGVPATSVWREFESITTKFAQASGNADMEFFIKATLYNPAADSNHKYYYDMLRRYQGDDKVYNELKKRLIDDYGYTEEGIASGIRSRIKNSDEYKTAYEAVSGIATTGIEDNKWYLTLPKAEQKDVMSRADSYASATALAKVDSTYQISGTSKSIGQAVTDGLTAGEYLLFSAAKRKIDAAGDNNGSYTGKEQIAALRELDWMSDSKRELLFTNTYENRTDDMEAVLGAGLSFNEFLTVYERYGEIDNEDLKASGKALKWANWLDGRYTPEQSDTVAEYFTYFSGAEATPTNYNKFTDAGIDYNTAYTLADSINQLKPVEGKTSVNNLQKYRVVVDSGLSNADQMRAMKTFMPETGYTKLRMATLGGLKLAKFVTYLEGTAGIESDTEDGVAISGSRKLKILTFINHMLATTADKDKLYLLAGYAEDTMWEVPWNGSGNDVYAGDINQKLVNGRVLPKLKKLRKLN